MLLCLDIGNTNIFGGVFEGKDLKLRFRITSQPARSSDEFGLFLKQVLRENNLEPSLIKAISLSTVVPDITYSIRSACIKYFDLSPFMLTYEKIHGLTIDYYTPQDLGADRIANTLAAIDRYPNQHILIVDFGTATTICAINKYKHYLGGAILPGLKLSMSALQTNTAQLKSVAIVKPASPLGKSTTTCLQSGLYYGQLGAIESITNFIKHQAFNGETTQVIGTGGFAYMFKETHIFSAIIPDLVLEGLCIVYHQARSKV